MQHSKLCLVSMKASEIIFKWMRYLARWPKLDSHRLEKIIGEIDDENKKRELKEDLEQIGKAESSCIVAVPMMIGALYFIKSFLLVGKTLDWFNYPDILSNFIFAPTTHISNDVGNASPLVHFTCMTTNCSRLTQDRSLVEDMIRLPVFAICDPLTVYYPVPFKYLERVGLLLSMLFGFGPLLSGALTPTIQLISPRSNECILFMHSPSLAVESMRARLSLIISRLMQHSRSCRLLHTDYDANSDRGYHARGHIAPSKSDTHHPVHSLDDNSLSKYLPVVRTGWFRCKMNRLFSIMALNSTLSTILFLSYSLSMVTKTEIYAKKDLIWRFNQEMRHQNCAIWLTHSSSLSSSNNLVDLGNIDFNWTFLALIELVLTQVVPGLMALMSFIMFYMTAIEIVYWQSEIQNQLMFLVEVRRLSFVLTQRGSFLRSLGLMSHLPPRHQVALQYVADKSLDNLRQEFKRANELSLYVFSTRLIRTEQSQAGLSSESRMDSALAFQDLSMKTMLMIDLSDGMVELNDLHVLLMERVYVNFSLYLELMQQYELFVYVPIIHGYILLYGILLISIWYCKQILDKQISSAIQLLIMIVWLVTNSVLLISSAIHAKVSSILGTSGKICIFYRFLHESQIIQLYRTHNSSGIGPEVS